MNINIDSFVEDYLRTAAWVSCDSGENTNFTKVGKAIAKEDCLKFITAVQKEFPKETAQSILEYKGTELEYLAAHDFFLTRNGHGAGFWDKPENYGGQVIADKLTDICKEIGSTDCYHVRGKKSKLTF